MNQIKKKFGYRPFSKKNKVKFFKELEEKPVIILWETTGTSWNPTQMEMVSFA